MKLKKPHPQIFLFLGESPADLGAPFMRLQEFYESPSKLFRRRFFTVEDFKKWYCRTQSVSGKFTYFRDFYGYNIPGDIFREWTTLYAGRETEDEQRLLTLVGPTPDKFYVIGSPADSALTVDHELSHAFWHIFPGYKETMLAKLDGWNLEPIYRYLKENMYAPDVYDDETTSYIMFDDGLLHRQGVSTKKYRKLKMAMLDMYDVFKARHIKP